MTARELRIQVLEGKQVRAQVGIPGQPVANWIADDREPDEVTMQSVQLLDAWLNSWMGMYRNDVALAQRLLRRQTFEVMGRQLWNLLFVKDGQPNQVGTLLRKELVASGSARLRVNIEFADKADQDLKALPWEFLYEPRRDGPGRFLGVETSLLLTRYVARPGGRVTPTKAKSALRVQVVNAMPSDRKFEGGRAWVSDVENEIKRVSEIELRDTISKWDAQALSTALSDDPPEVVHVVGLCRGSPGNPEIFTNADDGWVDPTPLVTALTSHEGALPQLVILQLYDYLDGDASENFERLAPDLIKAGIPAVLAMQYAPTVAESGLGTSFYRGLNSGKTIGEAVQKARNELKASNELNQGQTKEMPSPAFAAPVLYLQEDGALMPGPSSEPGAQGQGSGADVSNQNLGTFLLEGLDADKSIDDETRQKLETWLSGQNLDRTLSDVQRAVSRAIITTGDRSLRKGLEKMGRRLNSLSQGSGHA